ncbi:hypothetical protein ACIPY6_40670 [Streptomyces sp. NPDC090054]|uniref:hypothetical protein n=1 Tax=Streptomyces sp. NPDC090054 TaxID=3365933 RepID=UPI00380B487C
MKIEVWTTLISVITVIVSVIIAQLQIRAARNATTLNITASKQQALLVKQRDAAFVFFNAADKCMTHALEALDDPNETNGDVVCADFQTMTDALSRVRFEGPDALLEAASSTFVCVMNLVQDAVTLMRISPIHQKIQEGTRSGEPTATALWSFLDSYPAPEWERSAEEPQWTAARGILTDPEIELLKIYRDRRRRLPQSADEQLTRHAEAHDKVEAFLKAVRIHIDQIPSCT